MTELAARLQAVGADRDDDLLTAAQTVLAKLGAVGEHAGKYNVRISGGKGVIVGDHTVATMTFHDGD